MIFQGIRTSIAKKPHIFVICQSVHFAGQRLFNVLFAFSKHVCTAVLYFLTLGMLGETVQMCSYAGSYGIGCLPDFDYNKITHTSSFIYFRLCQVHSLEMYRITGMLSVRSTHVSRAPLPCRIDGWEAYI